MSGLSWTLEGETLLLWEQRGGQWLPLRLGIGSHGLSIRGAGLLSNLFLDRGDSELADVLWAAVTYWRDTAEGRASAIVAQPVWGEDAGAGICAGCEEQCDDTERHYYCLPETGTVPLCLDCGPEESYTEHTAARLESSLT